MINMEQKQITATYTDDHRDGSTDHFSAKALVK